MSNRNSNSIHFQKPPLSEVVFGVWYSNINWSITDYGKFHSIIASSYPKTSVVNPIAPPGELGVPAGGLKFLTAPELPRVWYEGVDPAFVLQIQPDRMLVNWRRRKDSTTDYPHFDFLFKRFMDEWGRFVKYCTLSEIGTPTIAGFDLTYINHFVHGIDWQKPNDMSHYFKHLSSLDLFENLKLFGMDLSYPSGKFTVRTSVKRGSLVQERKEVFIVEIGIASPSVDLGSLQKAANEANEVLVSEFLRLTTDEAHKRWELTNA